MDFEAYLTALRGKTVSVIGIGVSNRPLIEKLLEKGVAVTARDKKESLGELGAELAAQGCKLKLGEDYLKDIHEDVIFRTPGLRPDVLELAAAAGLPLAGTDLHPADATTYGVGQLLLHAARHGARRLLLGLGGSATNDGGCGCGGDEPGTI